MTVTNGYATLDTVRQNLAPYGPSDSADDSMIELSIEAASRQIDTTLGFRLWRDADVTTRLFYAASNCVDLYEQPDMTPKAGISTTDGLIVKTGGDGVFDTTITSYVLSPPNAVADGMTYTTVTSITEGFPTSSYNRPTVEITARFGWVAIPDWAEKACVIQAIQLFMAKDAPFGVAGFGDIGTGLRVREALNPIAAALVKPHARPSIG